MALTFRWLTPPIAPWRALAERAARGVWLARRLGSTFKRFPDGTLLQIKHVGTDHLKLSMRAPARARYQFFGSLERLYKRYVDPVIAGRRLPQGCAVSVEWGRGGKPVVSPLVSSVLDPGDEGGWPYRPNPLLTDRYLRAAPFHQPDGAGFRQWFAASDPPERPAAWLMTAWQQARPLVGLGARSAGSAASFDAMDLGFDRAPTLFSGALSGARKSPQGSDWYGQAALVAVGERRFVVAVDADSVFYCYPASGYGSAPIAPTHPGESGNVPAALIKKRACPWPAWVTAEPCGQAALDGGLPRQELRARLRPLWSFNRAGTRAVCVAAHRAEPWSDALWRSALWTEDGAVDYEAREDTPGLVEVALTVSVIGERDEDFDFTVTVHRDIDSRAVGYAPVAAGYLLRPLGEHPADALVTLDYWHETDLAELSPPGITPTGYDPEVHPPIFDLRRPTKKTTARVSALLDGGARAELRSWTAYYACYPIRGDTRFFSPKIEDFPELADRRGQADYADHFTYICQINAMDLGAMAFCLSPTIRTLGDVRDDNGRFVTYGAEAAGLVTVVWNEEVDRQLVGHPSLKTACAELFDRTAPWASEAALAPLSCGATASGTPFYDFVGATELETATRYQRLKVTDIAGGFGPDLVVNAAEEGLLDFWNIRAVPALAGATAAVAPRLFSYFDGLPFVRPGLRFEREGAVALGQSGFDGYPLGAIHHASVAFLTLNALNALGNRFSVHPDGSWALFVGPVIASSALRRMAVNGVDQPLPALPFERAEIDRIVLMPRRAEDGPVVTSHADALRLAFRLPDIPHYPLDVRVAGALVQFRPASDDPGPQPWRDAESLAPLGVGWTTQAYVRRRWTNSIALGADFVENKPYLSYNPFTTFPSPRLEGGFMAGAR